jgi:hypothetical protein
VAKRVVDLVRDAAARVGVTKETMTAELDENRASPSGRLRCLNTADCRWERPLSTNRKKHYRATTSVSPVTRS